MAAPDAFFSTSRPLARVASAHRAAQKGGGGAAQKATQARQQQSAAEAIQELSKVISMMEKR